jgi:DNA polymerase I-like protein with 3'-5' exonuclease and polymerase domains
MDINGQIKKTQVLLALKGVGSKAIKNEDFLRLVTGNFSKQCLQEYEKGFPVGSKEEVELNMKAISALETVENNGLKIDFENLYKDHYKSLEDRLEKIKNEEKFLKQVAHLGNWREITVELQKLNYKIKSIEDLENPEYDNDNFIKVIKELISIQRKLAHFERVRSNLLRDGKIKTTFVPYAGLSGRVVSHTPSTQNFPGYWKDHILPMEDDHKVYDLDIKSADILALSFLSQEKEVYNLISEKIDFYKYVASKIFNQNSVADEVRGVIKAIANGVTYGMTGYGIAKILNESGVTKKKISNEQGDEIRNKYFHLFNKFQKYQKEVTESTNLSTLTGHTFSVEANYKNVAFGPQNFIATIMKQILIALEEKDLVKYVINVVHDSVWISCSQDKLKEVKLVMENVLLGIFTEFAFDDVDFIKVKELGGGK